ncbi:MAG: hypothetical protein K2G32_06080 [Oscillospiraceae bacterium]|nr:hypothetical protein [Oscillospiraceae bacterium]
MGYNFKKHTDFLLENACASIRYLVHRDMLKTPIDEPFMKEMQEQILQQANVQKHLAAQCPDGWFGNGIHGCEDMDCRISGLLSCGVEVRSPYIQKAITALTTPEIASQHKNRFIGGEALDAEGRGGNHAVIAQILSWVGYSEDYPIMAEQIALAQEHLFAVLDYTSPDDFSVKMKKYRCYKPNARFPGANHISLLNATKGWRTGNNMEKAKAAVKHGYELMKDFDEHITYRKPKEFGNGVIGPFNYNWQALRPVDENDLRGIMESSYNYQFGFWLGSVSGVPDWVRQSTQTYELLAHILDKDTFMEMIPEKALKAFRQIMGREPDWRKKTSVKCDVMFAILNACWPVLNE